jgi:Ca2+-binding RTX toxin-like protein
LDGGSGRDAIIGSDDAAHPLTRAEVYDVIFGGGDADSLFDPLTGRTGLSGRAGNDFIYADHDYNRGTPVATLADGDVVDGGLGLDTIIALGADDIRRATNDLDADMVLTQEPGIAAQLQAGLSKKAAKPVP